MKEKLSAFRPAVAAFVTMMAMSLPSNCLSFFLAPICEDLQVGRGQVSLIFSLMTVTGAVTNPLLGQYAGKKGVRKILLVSGIWSGAGMLLFSVANHLWVLYAAAFFMGAFSTNCVALCANVIVQQAYMGAQASGILGVVMAGSGVGGMIFSLILPNVIAAQGWQFGIRIMAAAWAALLWLAAWILGDEKIAQTASVDPSVGLGMTRAEALKSPRLYLQMVIIVILCACCGVQQQIPSLLEAYGFDAGQISVMASVLTASLAAGKIVQGVVYGKLGVKNGGCIMLAVFAAGMLAMLSKSLAYPGLVMLALGFGIYTTLLPQVTRATFGSREYAAIWGLLTTAGCVGTFLATPLWGMVYDMTGSYALGLIAAPVLLMVALGALLLNFRGMER